MRGTAGPHPSPEEGSEARGGAPPDGVAVPKRLPQPQAGRRRAPPEGRRNRGEGVPLPQAMRRRRLSR
ncbi:hypothetical protein STENM223S_09053 [Streptomyces tendae]